MNTQIQNKWNQKYQKIENKNVRKGQVQWAFWRKIEKKRERDPPTISVYLQNSYSNYRDFDP